MSENKIFQWTDDLSIGFEEIDLHHKKLLLILNKFKDILMLGEAEYKIQIGKIIKNLSDYTEYHFAEEEKFMKIYDYPGYEAHREIHTSFINKLKTHLPILLSGNLQKGAEFSNFLGDWLLDHIAVADHQWADYIHSKK
ncbi:bacteriohemerythrin [Treponema sp. OMZ 840]|uniref:bacteriohemerythrin n=1 Tax=Treponema sp. OMZ 840 TaxID=244313 RepID=UPI003D919579